MSGYFVFVLCLHDLLCVLYDYRYGIFVCKCVSVSECKLCYIIYVVVQRAKRKTAVAILVPQFSYFNFHMNFSCKLSVYIYICFLCMKIENKFYSILTEPNTRSGRE